MLSENFPRILAAGRFSIAILLVPWIQSSMIWSSCTSGIPLSVISLPTFLVFVRFVRFGEFVESWYSQEYWTDDASWLTSSQMQSTSLGIPCPDVCRRIFRLWGISFELSQFLYCTDSEMLRFIFLGLVLALWVYSGCPLSVTWILSSSQMFLPKEQRMSFASLGNDDILYTKIGLLLTIN